MNGMSGEFGHVTIEPDGIPTGGTGPFREEPANVPEITGGHKTWTATIS